MALLHDLGCGVKSFDCDLKTLNCIRDGFGLVFRLCLFNLQVLKEPELSEQWEEPSRMPGASFKLPIRINVLC